MSRRLRTQMKSLRIPVTVNGFTSASYDTERVYRLFPVRGEKSEAKMGRLVKAITKK